MLRPEPLTLNAESRALYERFVPAKHPLRWFDEVLDFSFILPLVSRHYCKDYGRPAEHPERMWRLLFAQYFLNLSDDKVCLAAHESMALRLFLRLDLDERPVHPSTLQRFRFQRLQEGDYLAIHFALLRQAAERGLLDPGERQIFDTTHVRSNTRVVSLPKLLLQARDKVVKEVKRLDPAFGAELEAQAEADRSAYRQAREEREAKGLPKPTKAEKIATAVVAVSKTLREVERRIQSGELEPTERLNVALALLAKVIADREDGAQERLISVHDPEARKGKKGFGNWDGRKLALNIQERSRLIVAAQLAPANRTDADLVEPLLDQQQEAGLAPAELTADKGADHGPLRARLRKRGITAHVPITRASNAAGPDLYKAQEFAYDPAQKTLTCPAGRTTGSMQRQKVQTRDGYVFSFSTYWCRSCARRGDCRPAGVKAGRQVFVSVHRPAYEAAKRHNEGASFRLAYARRGRIESKVWELVHHGCRRCRYLGNLKGRVQLWLAVTAINAKRIVRLLRGLAAPPPGTGAECAVRVA